MEKMFLAVKRHGYERPNMYINIANAIGFKITDSSSAMKIIYPTTEIVLADLLPQHVAMTYAQLVEIFTRIVILASDYAINANNQFSKEIERICKDCGAQGNMFEFKDGILKLIL
jgi:hypothetical protein